MGIKDVDVLKGGDEPSEQQLAEIHYPHHSSEAALANYRAGHEVWDTNGDMR